MARRLLDIISDALASSPEVRSVTHGVRGEGLADVLVVDGGDDRTYVITIRQVPKREEG